MPAAAPQRQYAERAGVIGIVVQQRIHFADCAFAVRVAIEEADPSGHAAGSRSAEQQSVEHERRQRLSGFQQAVGSAMPASVFGLLSPEVLATAPKSTVRRLRLSAGGG